MTDDASEPLQPLDPPQIDDSVRQNLQLIADFLKKMPFCHACVVEGQEHNCVTIHARWAGREILKTLERPGWTTNALKKK